MSPAAQHPGESPPTACSVLSEAVAESAYGTATPAVAWLALEQAGPWGRDAVLESHLPRDVGAAVADAVRAIDGRLALLRSPGQHADDHRRHSRRVLLASCRPGREWLIVATVKDPRELLSADFAALAAGDAPGVLDSLPGSHLKDRPQLLVCTNGRRDVCCAVRGRPVAEGAAAGNPGQVWETSHTGGHRFAPTGLLLPSGLMLGRLSASTASDALRAVARDEFPLDLSGPRHDRGRCGLSTPAQVAESAVRQQIGERGLHALRVTGCPAREVAASAGVTTWQVDHDDGRCWHVSVESSVTGPPRPVSCGQPAESQRGYAAMIR